MLRQIGTIVSSLFLFSCYGLSDSQVDTPIVEVVGSGSDTGSGSDSDSCPVCSGSACCDEPEPHATPPAETQTDSSSTVADQRADATSVEDIDEDGVTVYSDPVFNDPTNGCTQNLPNLPAGCTVFRGNARWLYCWYQNGYATPVGCLAAGGFLSSCELSDDTINMISAMCNMRANSQDRITCAIDAIRNGIGGGNGTGGNVCRHFARCFKRVYEAMGFSQSYLARWIGVAPPAGHAFNTCPTTTGTYYVDASNDILFWCPN
jgi:hypothetical protein